MVDQLITQDPAAVSALWAGGLPVELILRVLPKLLPGDLQVPEFVPVLVADLQNAVATASTADAVTDAQIDDAVVHARYQDLLTTEPYSDPQVRQDLSTAQRRFAMPLIRDCRIEASVSAELTALVRLASTRAPFPNLANERRGAHQ